LHDQNVTDKTRKKDLITLYTHHLDGKVSTGNRLWVVCHCIVHQTLYTTEISHLCTTISCNKGRQ